MLRVAAFALLFACCLVVAAKKSKCVDGVDNVIVIDDLAGANSAIKFHDVKVLTYDSKKQPRCHEGGPSIKFPGYLKVHSGEVEIANPLRDSEGKLKLELTIEKNSFMIGKVCERGVSKTQFVPNEVCSFDLCQLIGHIGCAFFEKTGLLTIEDLPATAQDYISLGALPMEQIAGEWQAELHLKQSNKLAGAIRIGKKGLWTNIEPGKADEADSRDEL